MGVYNNTIANVLKYHKIQLGSIVLDKLFEAVPRIVSRYNLKVSLPSAGAYSKRRVDRKMHTWYPAYKRHVIYETRIDPQSMPLIKAF